MADQLETERSLLRPFRSSDTAVAFKWFSDPTQWLGVARKWFGFTTVYAFAHPENSASLHIIQKLGFDYLRMEHIYEMEAMVYGLYLPNLLYVTQ